jgi:hypothetical protein
MAESKYIVLMRHHVVRRWRPLRMRRRCIRRSDDPFFRAAVVDNRSAIDRAGVAIDRDALRAHREPRRVRQIRATSARDALRVRRVVALSGRDAVVARRVGASSERDAHATCRVATATDRDALQIERLPADGKAPCLSSPIALMEAHTVGMASWKATSGTATRPVSSRATGRKLRCA